MKKLLLHTVFLFSSILACARPASAYEGDDYGPWVVRGSLLGYFPGSSEDYTLNGQPIDFQRAGDKMISTSIGMGVDGTYFFTDHIGVNAGISYIFGQSGTLTSSNGSISAETSGKYDFIPIYTTLQYHIAPYGAIRPYVGAGAHYTFVQNSFDGIKVDGKAGLVLQAGADWWLENNLGINMDVKYMTLKLEPDYSSLINLPLKSEVSMNPVVLSAGLAYRF